MHFVSRQSRLRAGALSALCIGGVLFAPPRAAHAQAPLAGAPAAVDPQARALLDRMVAAYKALSSYAATAEVRTSGQLEANILRASVVFQRPDRASIAAWDTRGLTRVIADGEHLFVVAPGDAAPARSVAAEPAIRAALQRGGIGDTVLAALIGERDPLASRAKDLKSLSLGKPESVGGVAVDTVSAVLKGPEGEETLRFTIGRNDHLLRAAAAAGSAGGRPFRRTETYASVRVNPVLPAAIFTYVPPGAAVAQASGTEGASSGGDRAAPAALPSVEPVRYDFGEVSLLDTTKIEHTFSFKNVSGTPLTIERLAATCGCTSTIVGSSGGSAPFAYPTLAPGESTDIRVTVNLLPLRPGALHKSVAVYAQGNPQPVARYEMAGTLLAAVSFAPTIVDLGSVRAGEARPIVVTATLDARLAASGKLPPLVSSNPAILVEPVSDDRPATGAAASARSRVLSYRVSLAPEAPIGGLMGTIAFAPGEDATRALAQSSVFVIAQVAGVVSAQPQAVAFGVVASGRGASRPVVLRGATLTALKNRRIASDSPWITLGKAAPAQEATPQTETLEVILSPDAPAGVLQTQLTVTLENGQRLLLPVSAYVTPAAKP